MLPYLHLWHLQVPTFGLMLWLAAVAAAIIMDRGFKRAAIDADAVGWSPSLPSSASSAPSSARHRHPNRVPRVRLARSLGFGRLRLVRRPAFRHLRPPVSGLVARIGALRTLDLAAPAAPSAMASDESAVFSPAMAATASPPRFPGP